MTFRFHPRWALGVLAFLCAACGAAEPDRFQLRTPGARTGQLPITPPAPRETPPPAAKKAPVTRAERRVVRGWSDELRHGHVRAAARYFSVPTLVSNTAPGSELLGSASEVEQFNRGLPCGAKLRKLRRGIEGFVVATFTLTERPGAGECGSGTGKPAAVAFLIRKSRITHWVRVDPDAPDPAPAAPTPAPGTRSA